MQVIRVPNSHVGYTFVIHWDGTIYQTRALDEEGAHCFGQNTSSIGVCFMGNSDLHEPSPEQKKAWIKLYKQIHADFPNITRYDVYPHRKYANKTCHGRLLSDDYYSQLVVDSPYDKDRAKQLIRTLEQLINRLQALILQRRMK